MQRWNEKRLRGWKLSGWRQKGLWKSCGRLKKHEKLWKRHKKRKSHGRLQPYFRRLKMQIRGERKQLRRLKRLQVVLV